MLIGMVYLVTLILDPLILSFNFIPLLHEQVNVYVKLITWLIIMDMILVLVTGLPRDVTDIQEEADDLFEEQEEKKTEKKKGKKN